VAEGGFGGNSATPERIQKADSPAVLLVKSRTPHKSFLFLLEEKNRRAQIKNCEENFFAGWRALASGGGAERQSSQSGFSSKKVRILTKRHRQFSELGFWANVASPSLGLAKIFVAGLQFFSLPHPTRARATTRNSLISFD